MITIKSTGILAEIKLAKDLWHLKYRYRKNNKCILGKPDFILKKLKIAIFIFHRKDFITKKKPFTNFEYCENKILHNIKINSF